MNQIKKLARRGTAAHRRPVVSYLLRDRRGFALIMLGEGKEEAAMSAVMLIVMFGMIMLIFVLVGGVPYLRVGKMVKRQCEELGIELNEEEDFEMITKEISKSKNWLVSGIYGSNFAPAPPQYRPCRGNELLSERPHLSDDPIVCRTEEKV